MHSDDIVQIQQLYALYGYLVDDRDWGGLPRVFADDCIFDASAHGLPVMRGVPEIVKTFMSYPHPLAHHLTDVYVDAVSPDNTARVRARVIAMLPKGRTGSGSYLDWLVRSSVGWRIAERVARPLDPGPNSAPSNAGSDPSTAPVSG